MKTNKDRILHKLATIFFSMILIMLSCVLSFSTAQASENMSISTTSMKIYFITSTKSQVENSAKALAEYQMARDGAGYVWQVDNYYYVIISAYENKNDAELVSAKLKADGEENQIIEKEFPSVSISSPIASPEARSILLSSVNLFQTTYRSLFDISVCLDTKIYDETNAFIEINSIFSKTDEVMKNFHIIFGSCENQTLESLYDTIVDLNESLGLLAENIKLNDKQTLISQIRNEYVKVLDIYANFIELLK